MPLKDLVRVLIKKKRVEIVNGGLIMHDEALVSMKVSLCVIISNTTQSQIDQMAEGLNWLQTTFGVKCDIGYQIDPFGHSSFTPLLFDHLDFKYAVVPIFLHLQPV